MTKTSCFCGIVGRRKTFSLISSQDHCQWNLRRTWIQILLIEVVKHYTNAPQIQSLQVFRKICDCNKYSHVALKSRILMFWLEFSQFPWRFPDSIKFHALLKLHYLHGNHSQYHNTPFWHQSISKKLKNIHLFTAFLAFVIMKLFDHRP